MSERSRRSGTKVKPHEKFAELRALRESGKKRIDTYEIEQQEDLYEEVEEEDYKKLVRKRLEDDDFVVGDSGEGYVDDGREEWDQERHYYTDEEDEAESKMTAKEKKRKREEDKAKKDAQEGALHRYFNKTAPGATKPKVCALSNKLSELP